MSGTKVRMAQQVRSRERAAMYETFDQIEEDIRKSLAEAVSNRRSPMHIPVVGTPDADVRMMVLRGYDPASRTLRLHTDVRSAKVALIGSGAPVGVLFHDPDVHIQIRAKGQGRIETDGPIVDEAWNSSSAYARRCYLAEAAPGTPLAEPRSGLPPEVEGIRPAEEQLLPARANFAVLLIDVDEFDWLWLCNDGHRRARFIGSEWSWVLP
jgi:general stress protein 26